MTLASTFLNGMKYFFFQNDQRNKLYKMVYDSIFLKTRVLFVVDFPWNYPYMLMKIDSNIQ
jgi:hypothetical protein